MTNKNDNRNEPHTGSKPAETEFGSEFAQSKKAGKMTNRKQNS